MPRARPSGVRLTREDARLVLGMLERGDRQHDIAAWFGVNPARIAEIKARTLYAGLTAARSEELPPPGPHHSGRAAAAAVEALEEAKRALDAARGRIDETLQRIRRGEL